MSASLVRGLFATGLIGTGRVAGLSDDAYRLRFVQQGCKLGFPSTVSGGLLRLWTGCGCSDADVRHLAFDRVTELKAKAADRRDGSDPFVVWRMPARKVTAILPNP
jgi:hypothetical protein